MDHDDARIDNTTGVPDEPFVEETTRTKTSWSTRAKNLLAPPEPIGRAGWMLLASLFSVAAGAGYQGSLPSVLMTFVADSFGSTNRQQSQALAVIRLDIVLTLVLVRAADRVGRRRMVLLCATLGPILTSLCALTTSLAQFVAMQILSRAFVTAVAILVSVTVVEHLPAACRAWGAGCMVAAAALGSAVVQGASTVADRSADGWRYAFLLPLLSLPVLLFARRGVTESRRFVQLTKARSSNARSNTDTSHGPADHDESLDLPTFTALRQHGRRLASVALLVGLIALQSNPARQLRSDFLRSERGFSGTQLTLFGLLTNAPGVFGVVLGTVVSDRRSRRIVISIALLALAAGDAGMYRSHGSAIWVWAMCGSLLGAAALPGLGILAAELFPTAIRSTANGFTSLATRVFGSIGLLIVSFSADRYFGGNQGTVISALSFSLVLAVIVLWVATPETSRKELEELNPDDPIGQTADFATVA